MLTALRVIVLVAVGIILAPSTWAASLDDHSCGLDIRRFCKEVEPSGGGVGGCLRAHWAGLSDRCRNTQRPRLSAGLLRGCEEDRVRFCHGTELGGGRLLRCLGEYANELSPECRAVALPASRRKRR